ncbi:MAG TPA: mechanosensitive ion channel [Thermoguttaceae bacterium]|nr:mechanosensitive ion channel [Thermoguttaceae bacterium]
MTQESWGKVVEQTATMVSTYLPNVFAALVVLIVGWIAAMVLAGLVRVGLGKLRLNAHLARWCHVGETTEAGAPEVEHTASRIVFWVAMLFVLVGFFQTLGLTLVTEPLNQFLKQVFEYAPRVVGAGALLLTAWILAQVLRFVVRRVLGTKQIDQHLSRQVGAQNENRLPLAKTAGEAVYWLTFLIFLPLVLDALAVPGLLAPVQDMLTSILGYLPNIFYAVVIFAVGWFVARTVQRIVTNLLAAVGTDRFSEQVGVSSVLGKNSLSSLIGLITYILILIPVLIASLNKLALEAVTQPASQMLTTILAALPAIFAAFLVIAIAYVVGRIVAGLVSTLLTNVGFDRVWSYMGVRRPTTPAGKTPSQIIGFLALVAVMLLAVMQSLEILQFASIAALMRTFLAFAGNIIVGLVIFGVGLYIARLVANAIRATDAHQAHVFAPIAQVSIWVLVGAMALRQMGLADEIVVLAFGLAFGAVAVAAAIAFGIGGREAAKSLLDEFVERRKYQRQF